MPDLSGMPEVPILPTLSVYHSSPNSTTSSAKSCLARPRPRTLPRSGLHLLGLRKWLVLSPGGNPNSEGTMWIRMALFSLQGRLVLRAADPETTSLSYRAGGAAALAYHNHEDSHASTASAADIHSGFLIVQARGV
jgi:hypothetical protein